MTNPDELDGSIPGRDEDLAWKRLKVAMSSRELEVKLFWERGLFFWTFIAVAVTAFGAAIKGDERVLALIAATAGTFISICWTLANRGSRYWFRAWERKVCEVERDAIGICLISAPALPDRDIERDGFLRARRYSVTRLGIAVSDFIVVAWVAAIIWTGLEPLFEKDAPDGYVPGELLAAILALFVVTVAGCYVVHACGSHDDRTR